MFTVEKPFTTQYTPRKKAHLCSQCRLLSAGVVLCPRLYSWKLVNFSLFQPAGIDGIFIASNPSVIMVERHSRYESCIALSARKSLISNPSLSSDFVFLKYAHSLGVCYFCSPSKLPVHLNSINNVVKFY